MKTHIYLQARLGSTRFPEKILKTINGKSISLFSAIKEVVKDSKEYGLRGIFRGQGIGITKAIISLSLLWRLYFLYISPKFLKKIFLRELLLKKLLQFY